MSTRPDPPRPEPARPPRPGMPASAPHPIIHLVLLVALVLLAAACGQGTTDEPGPAAAATSPDAPAISSPSPLEAPESCEPPVTKLRIRTISALWVGSDGEPANPGELCLAAPAGKRFTVTLQNDPKKKGPDLPHNFSVWEDASARENLFNGDRIKAGKSITYKVPAMEAGVYLFRCDIHPGSMTGILNVEYTSPCWPGAPTATARPG